MTKTHSLKIRSSSDDALAALANASQSNTSSPASSVTRRKLKERKFYIVRKKVAHRAFGFQLLNKKTIFDAGPHIFVPPQGKRGFRQYPESPIFLSDPKLGRIHWDFEEYCGYWFISEKTKSVLEITDSEAFEYLKCEMRSPDGTGQPVRWLCDVVRTLDAVDEEKSTVRTGVSSDGSKVYQNVGSASLSFKESVVGKCHIFRMKYFEPKVICDGEFLQACKSAGLSGISFFPTK